MIKRYSHLILMLIILPFSNAYAQESHQGYFELETRRNGAARFDFDILNNLVVVPVIVNGSDDTLKMVLDTGVDKTLITGLPNEEEIFLNFTETIRIAGLGEGQSIDALYSTGNNVQIDESIGVNQEILVLKYDIFNLSSLLGTYVHGLIGHSLFKNFIVEIDYGNKWLKFHDQARFGERYQRKKNSDEWSSLPLQFRNNKPYIDVEIIQRDGSRIPLSLLIDSGASHALSLYHSANDEIYLPEKRVRSFLGNGLSGEIKGYWGKVDKLVMGDFELYHPVASYPDEEGIKRAIIYSSRDGSLGAEVLKRFKIMFNYQDSSMIFKPSRNFDEEFTYNMTGIEITTPYPNIRLYQVTHIREGSLAEKEGIMIGDYITELNGSSSSIYTLNEVLELFQGKKGNLISLKLARNDSTFRKKLRIEDILE